MFDLKLRVHTSLIGNTGYNNHAQSFFRALSKNVPLEIRNFTIGESWDGYKDEPHNEEPYVDPELKVLMVDQALWNNGELTDYPIYKHWPNPGKSVINLVLNETGHHFFYTDHHGYKIAFNVWESTLQPENFFNQLLQYDELWVPSKWQRDVTIKQGYPANKIFVIPEGVDVKTFFPEKVSHLLTNTGRFTFALFGRWDYRKSIKEVVETFLKTFTKDEPVDLIASIDNPFSGDNLKTTEARLDHYGLMDDRIKILHFPPREDYIKIMKSANVFVSCARSEGWNLPLIEAMACGTPSIYSACSAQMEFAEGRGLPVKILGERPASESTYNNFNETIGNYYEPDFDDLSKVMRDAYENYKSHKERAMKEAKEIHDLFNWERIAKLATDHLESRKKHILEVIGSDIDILKINYHFVSGPHVEIIGGDPSDFLIQFIDSATGKVEHEQTISNGNWVAGAKKYFVKWQIKVTDIHSNEVLLDETLDLKDKLVYVCLESNSLGDTLAWFPIIEEFRKKHQCQLICSTFNNEWFKKTYQDIRFVTPGTTVDDLVAMYSIGWYYDEHDPSKVDFTKNPVDPRLHPMQKTPSDILGLEFKEVKPVLIRPTEVEKKKQISIGIHGTNQAKYWNKANGWQNVIDWCKDMGYEVVIVSKEEDGFMRNSHPTGARQLQPGPIKNVIKELLVSEAFIGIGSGLTWLSWSLNVPTILISGFSYPYTETEIDTVRISATEGKCSGCFNRHRLNASDWLWCPDHKGTERAFECTRSISADQVITELKTILKVV